MYGVAHSHDYLYWEMQWAVTWSLWVTMATGEFRWHGEWVWYAMFGVQLLLATHFSSISVPSSVILKLYTVAKRVMLLSYRLNECILACSTQAEISLSLSPSFPLKFQLKDRLQFFLLHSFSILIYYVVFSLCLCNFASLKRTETDYRPTKWRGKKSIA